MIPRNNSWPVVVAGRAASRLATVWLAVMVALGLATTLSAAEPATAPVADQQAQPAIGSKWVQLKQSPQGELLALQTCIARYTGKHQGRPVTVDLIGAVHVGDRAYYQRLNQQFKQYDAVLYELVAQEGKNIPQQSRSDKWNPLNAMQGGMQSMLELEHQLEQVDYTPANFVHADMSPQEFFDTMKARGESVLGMLLKSVQQSAALGNTEQGAELSAHANADFLIALFSKNRAQRLKIAMARQFDQMEFLMSSFGGEEGSTLIEERNKKALQVLQRELNAGKSRLSIFYGAGHLADMHDRLVADFAMQPHSIQWMTAWDLTK